ncbi:hypothetical protein ACOT81_37185 [Streptomyces sp. WI04-05B]|uniref:hypothetical protein n=1 Tax=Streptomyces TaxID=1883 RepID=UPI0029A858C3|nr:MULTISPECIES: hypothetical protein [unclassified Streptomyces]MDX2546379.1 hypothetical protein [Streptomyces sp. WI04-05B]MDX2586260.1 hypothetical protein [Streptomyces sp. WI04-05A]MDX3748910.1 hypothetical protein [Streptomyces sp. AK08-02]
MADRGWYDDSDHDEVVQRAERATRFGWAAIAGSVGALGCAVLALAVGLVVAVLGCLYVVVAIGR